MMCQCAQGTSAFVGQRLGDARHGLQGAAHRASGAQQEPAADVPGHCLGRTPGRLPLLPRPGAGQGLCAPAARRLSCWVLSTCSCRAAMLLPRAVPASSLGCWLTPAPRLTWQRAAARLNQFFPKDQQEPFLTGPSRQAPAVSGHKATAGLVQVCSGPHHCLRRFPLNLAGFWTVQGLWAWIVLLPVTTAQVGPAACWPIARSKQRPVLAGREQLLLWGR